MTQRSWPASSAAQSTRSASSLHDLDVAARDDLFEDRHEVTVELDRAHVRARVASATRERTDAGADLDDASPGCTSARRTMRAAVFGVGEEVLTERLATAGRRAREQRADLARRHRSTPNTRAAFARVSSAISLGVDAARPRPARRRPRRRTRARSACPRYGSGVRNGESVSTSMRSAGVSAAAARRSSAFLNETMPLNDR